MSYLASSPITLDSKPLQVADKGFSIGALSIVDEAESWKSRSVISALRDEGDALGFDMVTITGARVRVDYVGTGHAVPVNNEAELDRLYRKVLRRNVQISGSSMDAADFAALLASNDTAQQYWSKRARIMAQLGEADLTYTTATALATAYATLTKPTVPLVSPFLTSAVTFAEGDSCSFSSYIDNIVTDFNFDLTLDIEIA